MDRKEQLNDIVRGALFSEVRVLSDGRSIVMDPETERLYYRKRLSVYSIPVFRFLKEHKHKNLPEIHLFWQEEGDLIVIEELIQGHTLEELLDSGKALYAEKGLCFEEKKRILLELCDALEYLHSANPPIIHRDIKASNVMLREDGTLKLIDYDAAKQYVAEKSRDTVLIGTQGIAAPEQYGFAQSDERTDIFALGKLMERLLPESKQARGIAARATKLQPELRFENVKQVHRQIERLWDPAISGAEHRKQVVIGKLRDKRTRWALAGLAILVLLIIGGIWFGNSLYPELFIRRPAYNKGIELMAAGEYEEAAEQFAICGTDYKDVKNQLKACELEMEERRKAEHLQSVREEYEKAANEATEVWRSSKTTEKERAALEACNNLLLQGLDDGESLRSFCAEILKEALQQLEQERFLRAKDIMFVMEKNLTEDGIRASILEENRTAFLEALEKKDNYGSIAEYYEELSKLDEQDYSDQILENRYRQAMTWKKNEAYLKAAELFLDIYEYKDSAQQKKGCNYLEGERLISQGRIPEAVYQLNKAEDYPGAEDLKNQAKAQYCREHADAPDTITRDYLEDLKKAGYTGAEVLEQEVETWKITFEVKEVSSYEVSVNLTFTGGPQDGIEGYRAVAYNRDGSSMTHSGNYHIKSGWKETLSLTHTNGNVYRNLKQIDVYDPNGKLLGTFKK